MQTFVPELSYGGCALVLDTKRLGKQRVECKQIYNALTLPEYGWKNHPATKMWQGFELGLLQYSVMICSEWIERGYKDTLRPWFEDKLNSYYSSNNGWCASLIQYPTWWGGDIHRTHQSNLLRKDPVWYSHCGWEVSDDLPYHWPV